MPNLIPKDSDEVPENDNSDAIQPQDTDLEQLKAAYHDALMSLQLPMREFAEGMVKHSGDVAAAYQSTTYDSSKMKSTVKRLMADTRVSTAIKLGNLIDYVENGYPLSWKRQQIQAVILACGDKEADTFNPAGFQSCMRLLAELDGNISKNNSITAGTINIVTGIVRQRG